MANLHLVRHGETHWNAQKRYQGSQDILLNDQGRLQAQETAKTLAKHRLAGVYSSPLARARETAAIIIAGTDHVISCFDELKEGAFGCLEGKTYQEVHQEFASQIAQKRLLSPFEQLSFKIIPEQESWMDVIQRALPLLTQIALKHLNQDVLVVTHGGVIQALIVYLTHCDPAPSIENGQVVTFCYEKQTLRLLEPTSWKKSSSLLPL